MTLLSVQQGVVRSMESHFTWQGPSRSDFAVREARCCEQHGKHFTWQGPSRSDFAVCVTRCCEKHGKPFHLAGAKQKWLCCL